MPVKRSYKTEFLRALVAWGLLSGFVGGLSLAIGAIKWFVAFSGALAVWPLGLLVAAIAEARRRPPKSS